jgi:hypothetical protein
MAGKVLASRAHGVARIRATVERLWRRRVRFRRALFAWDTLRVMAAIRHHVAGGASAAGPGAFMRLKLIFGKVQKQK